VATVLLVHPVITLSYSKYGCQIINVLIASIATIIFLMTRLSRFNAHCKVWVLSAVSCAKTAVLIDQDVVWDAESGRSKEHVLHGT